MDNRRDTHRDTATAAAADSTDVLRTLNSEQGSVWRGRAKWLALVVALLVVAYLLFGRSGGASTQYVTQEVTRGGLVVTVTATGNLQPRNQVDIGSELSGTVTDVRVDVNDEVKAGDVLAVLDTTRLKAEELQASSSLQSAEARVLQAVASEKESSANLARLQKVRELSGNKVPSQQEMDVAEAAVARATAELAAARASVAQSRAQLETVRTDLSKAVIRSPIDGVILVRSVEPGQTVAASLQAPVLFIMAQDLQQMELRVAVDEADVGRVAVDQEASFSVDAYPNERFSARITQVHFASSNTQSSSSSSSSSGGSGGSSSSSGVVTYATVLSVDNPDLLLRPGMTATVEIVTSSVDDVVLVPNAALRFSPVTESAPASRPQSSPLSAIMPGMGRRPSGFMRGGPRQQGGMNTAAGSIARAWVLEGGQPVEVVFRAGLTDGRHTQILEMLPPRGPRGEAAEGAQPPPPSRQLEPGTAVIVDSGISAS